jgi:hypothetical protein
MPFCSSCGATVSGAYCSRCGGAAPSSAAPAAPVRRKTSPLVWILAGIGGLVFLGLLAVFGATYYFVRNPEVALAKIITAADPNAEVVRVDRIGRQLTIRNKRDGKETTLSFDDVKRGRFSMTSTDSDGRIERVEMGAGKVPAWVPRYPGAFANGQITATVSGSDVEEGGVYSFKTTDDPAKVIRFFEEECRRLGMTPGVSDTSHGGAHIEAEDGQGRSLQILVSRIPLAGGALGSVTFKRKR